MTYRVKVFGPNIEPFGCDIYNVEKPSDVLESPEGSVVINVGPVPERPHPRDPHRILPALRGRSVIYPRGEVRKVIVEDVVES